MVHITTYSAPVLTDLPSKITYSPQELKRIGESRLFEKIKEVSVKMKIFKAEAEAAKWEKMTVLLKGAAIKCTQTDESKSKHLFSQSVVSELFYQKACEEVARLNMKLIDLQSFHPAG